MTSRVSSVSFPYRRLEAAASQLASALWNSRVNLLALFCVSLLPLGVRLLVMSEGGYDAVAHDKWGFYSDLGTGLAAAAVLVLVYRFSRLSSLAMAAIWLLMNVAFYEFFHAYGSPYFFIYAAFVVDPTFMQGSGIHLNRPLLTGAVAAAAIAALALAGRRRSAIPAGALVVLALFGGSMAATQPWSDFTSPWRQRSFLSLNVVDVATRVIWPDTLDADLASSASLVADYMQPDLAGTPVLADPKPDTNVIIVFIEGVSGGLLPSLAAAHQVDSKRNMPLLDEWAKRHLSFSTFISHQRQSDRGLYAALCGDLPRLVAGLPKMTEIADSRDFGRRCLPQILGDHGYNSIFLHAARGSFMHMDRFMLKIGFRRELASEDFDPALPRGPWGIDDGSLYEAALEEIDALAAEGKPYLATLFTTSTHHPYGIPDSFTEHPDWEPRARAVAFSDHAVAKFLSALEARGHLDDTLVLVTSDEAAQVHHRTQLGMEGTLVGMTENWGVMVAITPERLQARVDEVFQQADLPLSVLDYLGLSAEGRHLMGRSFFRSYRTGRSFFSANVYKRHVQEYVEGSSLTVCDESLDDCRAFDASAGPLFSPKVVPIEGPAEPSPLLRAMRAYSVTSPVRPPALGG